MRNLRRAERATTWGAAAVGLALGSAAMATTPQTTVQPSTGVNFVVESNSNVSGFDGAVQMFAGSFTPDGTVAATGATLSDSAVPSLYTAIGTTFGGGGGTFQVPNLNGAVGIGAGQGSGLTNRPLGASVGQNTVTLTTANAPASLGGSGQSFTNMQPSLALNYYICLSGVFPSTSGGSAGGDAEPYIGTIISSASPTAPSGFVACNGQTLSISAYQAAFSLLLFTYGGNFGTSTFALPDLRGRSPMGVGQGAGLTNRTLGEQIGTESTTLTADNFPAPAGSGQTYSNIQPSLGLNYIICEQGIYPTRGDGPTGPDPFSTSGTPVIGQVELYAGSTVPSGWALCDGQILSVSANLELFSIIGAGYGGNGSSTFALPDLEGRLALGDGGGQPSEQGVESLPVSDSELPAVTPEPTTLALVTLAVAPLLVHRRRRARSGGG